MMTMVRIDVKVTKYIFLHLFTLPFVFLFSYGMLVNSEAFLPFFFGGLAYLVLGVFGLKHLFEMLTETVEYVFEIDEQRLQVEKLVNAQVVNRYSIEKQNIETFSNRYRDNYGAVTTTYEFVLKDGIVVIIKDDFGSDEAKIMEGLLQYGYIPQSMIEQFKKRGMLKNG